MTDTVNVPREAVERFKDALENMPDVFERHAKGQMFNAYDLDDDGGSKAVCIGPITSRPLSLFAAPADVAELVEASLKLAAHALAAPKAEAQGWQLIDTAPKDGTHIDVWREEGGLDTVFWGLPHHECGEMGQYCDSDWHSIRAPGWVCSTFHEFLGCSFNPFTHWKPVDKGPHAQTEAPKAEPVNDDGATHKRMAQALSHHPEVMVVERSDPSLELTVESLEGLMNELRPPNPEAPKVEQEPVAWRWQTPIPHVGDGTRWG